MWAGCGTASSTSQPDDYMQMALGKTGYYSGIAPLKAGAIIGGATEQEIEALAGFGKNCSIAFQIQDDLLNVLGDVDTMGKDYLSDIQESKRTLMVIHCLARSSAGRPGAPGRAAAAGQREDRRADRTRCWTC